MKENSIGVLNLLDRSRGYDTALLTTFNFDIDFFERAILSRLTKNSIKKISVFVDAKELTKALNTVSGTSIGQRYVVNPVSMNSSFHPKVILLLGEKKARLIIGSGNLKLSGYYINNEIFDCVDYDAEHTETRSIIFDAINFFLACNERTPKLDANLLKDIQKKPFYRRSQGNESLRLIENTTNSIIDQLSSIIKEPVTQITIAVPYFDNKLRGLEALHNLFSSAKIVLYLQREKSTFPENEARDFISEIKVFDNIRVSEKENCHFFHGKVFLFKTASYDYILYGSSNCTLSAIGKSSSDGGNIECDLFLQGAPNEFDNFFSLFSITENAKPCSQLLVYAPEEHSQFYYKYGVLDQELCLHIGYYNNLPENLIFTIYDRSQEWKRVGNEIIVTISSEITSSTVFKMEISYDNTHETLICWYIDKPSIEITRYTSSNSPAIFIKPDFGDGDHFREDYDILLKQIGSCKDDYIQQQRTIQQIMSAKDQYAEEDTDESEDPNSENFIVYVLPPPTDDEEIYLSKYKEIEKCRNSIVAKYLHSPSYFFSKERAEWSKKTATSNQKEVGISESQLSTTEDQKFSRFVKKVVRNLLDDSFVEIISEDHFLSFVFVVFCVFDKYRNNHELFQDKYIVESRCDLMIKVLNKISDKHEKLKEIISKTYGILLDNHLIISQWENSNEIGDYEKYNRRVLLKLNNRFNLRDNYPQYLVVGDDMRASSEALITESKKYFEKLYGYLSLAQIREKLGSQMDELCEINVEKNIAKILLVTEKPTIYLKPDTEIIRDLVNYSKNEKYISRIIWTVSKLSPQKETEIVEIEHIISIDHHNWSRLIKRKNGNCEKDPIMYLNF